MVDRRKGESETNCKDLSRVAPESREISCRPFAFKTPCGEDEELFRGQEEHLQP